MIYNTKYPITLDEIKELKKHYPNDGRRKNRSFSHTVIMRLLDECQRLLEENTRYEQMVQVSAKQE